MVTSFLRCCWLYCGMLIAVAVLTAAPAKPFAIEAGDASQTLDVFAAQSGEQLVYLIDNVRGHITRPVHGSFTSDAALVQMLTGTALTVHRDGPGGPITVTRRVEPHAGAAPRAGRNSTTAASSGSELLVLPVFTVSETPVDRYRATDAISAVRVRAPLLDTPNSISVLTRETIDDLAPGRIFDVARYVAGVQEGRGIQFQDRMILRGFESNGQRTVDNFLQPEDADNIDEVLVDRIEIAKGPNAILAPAGAPGGAINVITKAPLFHTQRSVTALVGLFDAQKLSVDLTGPLPGHPRMAYRVVGSLQDSRRYWSDEARLRGKVIAPMFTYNVSDETQLTVKLVAAEHWVFREPLLILDPAVTASTSDPYLAPGISRRGLNGIQPWSHVGTHSADVFALLTTSLTEHISLRLAANGRYLFEDSTQEFLTTPSFSNRYNPATGELTQDTTWMLDPATNTYAPTSSPFFTPAWIPVRGDKQATRRKTVNLQADAVARYRFGTTTSQTVTGLALSRRTNYGRGVSGALPGIDLSRPDLRFDPQWSDAWTFYNDSQFTNWQVYVNQRFGFFADRVQLTAGLLHYDTYTYARNQLIDAPAGILDDKKDMGMASLLVKPLANLSLYYSRSSNSSPVIANNVALWRDGVQDEFGIKTEFFKQRLSFNAAYFKIAQTNVTVPNPDRQTDLSAPETLVSDLGNHGIELELTGGLTPNLSVIGSFTKLRMEDSLGRPVRAVADRTASLLLNYRFNTHAGRAVGLSFGVSYSGRRAGDTPINFTPLNAVGQTSFFLKSYSTVTLGASYRWSEKLLLRANIDNVLDDKGYIQLAGGRVSGTGITTAAGMNIKFSATFGF
jgi:iron complex outermembrane receptor protein